MLIHPHREARAAGLASQPHATGSAAMLATAYPSPTNTIVQPSSYAAATASTYSSPLAQHTAYRDYPTTAGGAQPPIHDTTINPYVLRPHCGDTLPSTPSSRPSPDIAHHDLPDPTNLDGNDADLPHSCMGYHPSVSFI